MAYEQSPQDEGYSEDPLTVGAAGSVGTPLWLRSIPVAQRTEFVMNIIDALPTSAVSEIVRRLRPRLYIDFFQYLPAEVCLKILSFLDPISLINTARASHDWMVLSLDCRLWEELYILEGFRVIRSEVQRFEESLNLYRSKAGELLEKEHASKKGGILDHFKMEPDSDSDMMDVDPPPIQRQTSIFGTHSGSIQPKRSRSHLDVKMEYDQDVPPLKSSKTKQNIPRPPAKSPLQDHINRRLSNTSIYAAHHESLLSSMSSLVVLDHRDQKMRLNWQYLFSQRRRLEANWEAAKYTNFQLPHPKHPEEAHEECIYTIQYSGKYLVSGSRDRTLRIWNLDTRRLVRPPLRAHVGSVLCLQFDADPEEDLIVSGSSDSTVILWKFSTGQIIQRLKNAHRESVLNVRFDKRVLVTCSKDKTIKVFNRKPLAPGDHGYPQLVSSAPTVLHNYGFNPSPASGLPIKPSYSMLGSLEGHGAAVNAVQIFGDEIVSASGDRTVKVWNWVEQSCIRTLLGHNKGIACVQYDGRRIVSGSSDNEVKVFDKQSGLEVASLRGHSNLVRTVQAGFGDLPYSVEEDKEDAKMVDAEFFKAVDAGTIVKNFNRERRRPRNAGSRKPEHINAYGARLPPGGGGGKFGRIVSGSYDETIIIWRRDKEGAWKAQHTLRQEEAARRASRNVEVIANNQGNPSGDENSRAGPPPATEQDLESGGTQGPFAPGSAPFYHRLIDVTMPRGPIALRQTLQAHPPLYNHLDYLLDAIQKLPTEGRQVMSFVVFNTQQQQQLGTAGSSPATSSGTDVAPAAAASNNTIATPGPSDILTTTSGQAIPGLASALNSIQASVQQAPAPTSAPVTTTSSTPAPAPAPTPTTAPAPAPAQTQTHAPHLHPSTNMARVFKLQFDARRIICCSQTSTIVGWDFANGDKRIIEASPFFAPIE